MNPDDAVFYIRESTPWDTAQNILQFCHRSYNQSQIKRNIRDMKRQERPYIRYFLDTGVPDNSVVYAFLSEDKTTLSVAAQDIAVKPRGKRTPVLFQLKDGKLVANQRRVDQIRVDLERFATSQGYELAFTDDILSDECSQRVLLQRWPKRKEVDDSKQLVTVVAGTLDEDVDDEDEEEADYPF